MKFMKMKYKLYIYNSYFIFMNFQGFHGSHYGLVPIDLQYLDETRDYQEETLCLIHGFCSKTCLVGLIIRSIFRGKTCTSASGSRYPKSCYQLIKNQIVWSVCYHNS